MLLLWTAQYQSSAGTDATAVSGPQREWRARCPGALHCTALHSADQEVASFISRGCACDATRRAGSFQMNARRS